MVKAALIGAVAAGVCLLLARTPVEAQTPAHAGIEDVMNLAQLGTSRGGLSLSPDGQWLAVFEQHTDLAANDIEYRLLLLPTRGVAPPRVIGDGGGVIWHDENGRRSGAPADRFARWSPDSLSVAYLKRVEDRVELWRSGLDGHGARLAAFAGDVRDFAWIGRQQLVVLEATPRALLAQNATAEVAQGYRLTDDLDLSFSQRPLPNVMIGARRVVIDVANGATRAASAEEAAALTPAPDAASAWIGPRDAHADLSSPPLGLFAHTRDGHSLMCSLSTCSGALRDAGVMSDGRVWFERGEGFDDGDIGLYLWRPDEARARQLRSGDELYYGCNGGNGKIYCLWETPAHPRRIVAIDAVTGAINVLYDPNPVWNAGNAPRIERIAFTDDHGLQSYAHLVYPAGYRTGQRFAMVIVQYRSRGFLRGGTGGEYPIFAYAARGYFVMSVERPEAKALAAQLSPLAFDRQTNLSGEEERMKLASLDGLIAQVVRRGLVDDDAIALTGLSDGAETLYWALAHRSFAAAVASNPPTDTSQYWLVSQDFRQDRLAFGIGSVWPTPSPWWADNAAALSAERMHTPLLMNLSQSEAIYAPPLFVRLRQLNVPVEAYLYPDAFHIKARPSQAFAAQRRAMAWIEFWLHDRLDDEPGDPDRSQRWGLMRRATAHAEARSPAAAHALDATRSPQ